MTALRCISLHQPWASLVAWGVKGIETRGWSTPYRGYFGIHAAKKNLAGTFFPAMNGGVHHHSGMDACFYRNNQDPFLAAEHTPLPLGAIVATANLVDCVPIDLIMPRQDVAPGVNQYAGNAVHGGYHDRVTTHPMTGELIRWADGNGRDISGQLPYGDFRPGRYAWILDDVKPTTERCPACWTPRDPEGFPCSTCMDHSGGFASRCEPIPAVGRQGWWNLEL